MNKRTLKIATYNIHGGWGMDKVLDLKRIAGVIKAMDADFVSVNEIDQGCVRSDSVDQPAVLAEYLGMNYHFAPALEMRAPTYPEQGDKPGLYGVAFFTPHPVKVIKQIKLPGLDIMEPRTAVFARVEAPVPFLAVVTHFCWEPKYEHFRVESVQKINAEVEALRQADPALPVLLLGDLNAEPYSAPIEEIRKSWKIANEGKFEPTHPSDEPREIIDYIAVKSFCNAKLVNSRIIPEKVASDHRPFYAELLVEAE